jgi:CelD/BcsL family acetyltransferase involved in cellulose biosynthesis
MCTLSIEEIKDIEKFRTLREPWNALLQKSVDNNIFLTWEWLFNWWSHYGGDKQLRIIIIREGNKIICIAPLMQVKYKQGFISINVIENLCSEDCDYSGIILTENKQEALIALLNYLDKVTKSENLVVRLYHVPDKSVFIHTLRAQYPSFSAALRMDEKPSSYCSYIMLPLTWDEFLHSLKSKKRYNLRTRMQNLQKGHTVEFEKYAGGDDIREKLQVLFEFHEKRWGKQSKFNTQQARDFYLNVSNNLYRNGWLDFSFLKVDGKPVSVYWGFVYDKAYLNMTNTFDDAYSKYGAGTLHLMKIFEDAIQKGLGKFDFLKGDEQYKLEWTTEFAGNSRIIIAPNSKRGKLRATLLQLLTKYRYARARSFRENIRLAFNKVKPVQAENQAHSTGENEEYN